jgi:ubiquinone/menaquinone biosynthesis C-methylase UbiE
MFPQILYELFSGNPRQGPGSNECTRKAYGMCKGLPARPVILDIGCGSGTQTLELARVSAGPITALDNYQPMLDTLNKRAQAEGLAARITTVNGSMFELPFAPASFDLIWSEGAIFIMGLEKGLREWKPLLKKGGYIVVSELTYIRQDIPQDLKAYWNKVEATVQYNEDNRKIIRDAGYTEIGDFILPASGWLDDFYTPLQESLFTFKKRYAGDAGAIEILDSIQEEIDIFNKYYDYYSYIFYVMQPKKTGLYSALFTPALKDASARSPGLSCLLQPLNP